MTRHVSNSAMAMSRYLWIALAAALLITRVGVAAHEVDYKNHKPGEICEWCVHAGSLKTGATGAAPAQLVCNPQTTKYLPFISKVTGASVVRARARGPPVEVSVA